LDPIRQFAWATHYDASLSTEFKALRTVRVAAPLTEEMRPARSFFRRTSGCFDDLRISYRHCSKGWIVAAGQTWRIRAEYANFHLDR
jgi:hypothetical protein